MTANLGKKKGAEESFPGPFPSLKDYFQRELSIELAAGKIGSGKFKKKTHEGELAGELSLDEVWQLT